MIAHIPHDSRARLIPLSHVLDHLQEAERTLKNCHTHPGDATLVCISAEQVRDLEVVLVRTDRKQKNLIASNMLAEAESERAATQSALARLRPVVSKAREGELSAEELVAAFKAEFDPQVARRRFLATQAESTTIRDENEVLTSPDPKTLPKEYAAEHTYVLSVLVTQMTKADSTAHLLLMDKYLSGELFTDRDFGLRSVSTIVTEPKDQRCLNLCMAYDIAVTVELAISVKVSMSGLEYKASLRKVTNMADAMLAVKRAMAADQPNLFS